MSDDSIMTRIDTVVAKLKEAKEENTIVQQKLDPGSRNWQRCEIIDDRLHEVLTALGQ